MKNQINIQFKNRSTLDDLFQKSVRLPIEPNLYNRPEIRSNLKVINDLTKKLNGCDKGLSGLFTFRLQELIGGEIYELNYLTIKLNNPIADGHLFVYKNGFCYDCDGVCSMTTLKYKKNIKKVYTESSLKYLPIKQHYYLYKPTDEEILNSYRDGNFEYDFTEEDVHKLRRNFGISKIKMKVRNFTSNVFKS